ncbi:MAG: hypothetical protein HQM11_10360 [SAR324 cluster bacterium]|nr:hypothetical protein [SAR324 cluster bacterium]
MKLPGNFQLSAFHGLAFIAVSFGLLTLKSGGSVLFIDGSARQAAGAYVPWIVWFNFLMGFVYIVAGIGFWMRKTWSHRLALMIFFATIVVFAGLEIHVLLGGAYEQRTVGAMIFRAAVWFFLFWRSGLKLRDQQNNSTA